MNFCTPIFSNGNLTKEIMRLPGFLVRYFFRGTKSVTLENWLEKKLQSLFNALADITLNKQYQQKKKNMHNNMNVLVDKGNDKINFYSDKSAEIKPQYTSINSPSQTF